MAVIDEVLARQYWPGENPVGGHIRRGNSAPWATVVGIVGHVKHSDLAGEDVKGKYYFPAYQMALPFMSFVVRGPADPGRLSRGAPRRGSRGGPHAAHFASPPDDRYGK